MVCDKNVKYFIYFKNCSLSKGNGEKRKLSVYQINKLNSVDRIDWGSPHYVIAATWNNILVKGSGKIEFKQSVK